MTLQLNQVVPTIQTLHEMVGKTALPSEYKCELIQDRFTLSFSQPRQCILVKKSEIIGVGLFVNEKTNSIDIDGIVPNKILNQVFFRNYFTRLLLIRAFRRMENEVAKVLTNQFQ